MIINTVALKELIDKYYNPKNNVTNSIDTEYLKALRKACYEYIEIMKIKRMKNDNYNKEFENILLKKGLILYIAISSELPTHGRADGLGF